MSGLSRRTLAATLSLALALAPRAARAWGFEGHRIVNAQAVTALPEPLRSLFEANADYLAEHSVDPDLWRAAGLAGEEPNHFLDMDAFGAPPFDVPADEAEHLSRHGAAAVERGRVPWRAAAEYRSLVAAFARSDAAAALRHAAILGHYVADAHVPLHAALNYDGQLSGQRGIHSRWESEMIDRFERQILPQVRPEPAAPIRNPVEATLSVLRESFGEAEAVLADDRASIRGVDLAATPEDDRYDDGYYTRLFEAEEPRLERRLSLAAERLAGFWLGAWEEAGRPALPPFRFAYVRGTRRGVFLSLDGAGEALLRQAIARGAMPTLARLRREGATAAGVITTHPAQTAVGHAALFTGAWPEHNGITGNIVLPDGAPLTAVESGFPSTDLRAEPIWAAAARQGLEATVASATQVLPFDPFLQERRFGSNQGRRLTMMEGYPQGEWPDGLVADASSLAPGEPAGWDAAAPAAGARELRLRVEPVDLFGLVYDDPADPAVGYDSLLVAPERRSDRGVVLKPLAAGAAGAIASLRATARGQTVVLHMRLYELAPDASRLLLWTSTPYPLEAYPPRVAPAALDATGGFFGNGASNAYRRGRLGPTLWEGGDGTAEERYLETVREVIERFGRLVDFAFDRTRWSLLVTYLPYPDEVFHLWLGYLDPAVPGHDPELARRLQPYVDRTLRMVDDHLAHLVERLGPEGVLAIGSDHGQIGSSRTLFPNRILARAGLVAAGPDGTVDLSRTRALYYAGNTGYVYANRDDRPEGILTAAESAAALRDAARALREARDPESRDPLFTDVREIDGGLELEGAPGYYASASATEGPDVETGSPAGRHLFGPERSEMRASFLVWGAGVSGGTDLGLIEQIDEAPTLSVLLGIEPPAQADGRVLERALAHPGDR